MVVKKFKSLINYLSYKRFERKINKAFMLGENKVVIDGVEFEIIERVVSEPESNVTVNFSSKGYEEWEQAFHQTILDKPLTKEDVSFDLNGKVPKLYIKDRKVWVVSMTTHYVTESDVTGTNVVTFTYVTKDSPEQKLLSIDRITGEVMHQ